MSLFQRVFALMLTVILLTGCGEKDEEKASQNRPAIPGY